MPAAVSSGSFVCSGGWMWGWFQLPMSPVALQIFVFFWCSSFPSFFQVNTYRGHRNYQEQGGNQDCCRLFTKDSWCRVLWDICA